MIARDRCPSDFLQLRCRHGESQPQAGDQGIVTQSLRAGAVYQAVKHAGRQVIAVVVAVIFIRPVQPDEERVGRRTQSPRNFPSVPHWGDEDGWGARMAGVERLGQSLVVGAQLDLKLSGTGETAAPGDAGNHGMRRRPGPGFKQDHLGLRIVLPDFFVKQGAVVVMIGHAAAVQVGRLGAVILKDDMRPRLGRDGGQRGGALVMILEIHPAHRLHHGVGIRLAAGLGEPVKNAGHPAAAAADGKTVPDEKHPVLGLTHSRQQQGKGGQQDQIVYSRHEHDEFQWG